METARRLLPFLAPEAVLIQKSLLVVEEAYIDAVVQKLDARFENEPGLVSSSYKLRVWRETSKFTQVRPTDIASSIFNCFSLSPSALETPEMKFTVLVG